MGPSIAACFPQTACHVVHSCVAAAAGIVAATSLSAAREVVVTNGVRVDVSAGADGDTTWGVDSIAPGRWQGVVAAQE